MIRLSLAFYSTCVLLHYVQSVVIVVEMSKQMFCAHAVSTSR